MIEKLRDVLENFVGFRSNDTFTLYENDIDLDNCTFVPLHPTIGNVWYVDGGQGEIFSTPVLSASMVKVAAVQYSNKLENVKTVSYIIIVHAKRYTHTVQVYSADMTRLIEEDTVSYPEITHPSLTAGAFRRYMELRTCAELDGTVCYDGSFDTFNAKDAKLVDALGANVCAIAKSSSHVTEQGQNPAYVLGRNGPSCAWVCSLSMMDHYVKLHARARHVFRFTGNSELLSFLVPLCADPILLGYPVGLVTADKYARVSKRDMMNLGLQLRIRSKVLNQYLQTEDVHSILDSISY